MHQTSWENAKLYERISWNTSCKFPGNMLSMGLATPALNLLFANICKSMVSLNARECCYIMFGVFMCSTVTTKTTNICTVAMI